MDLTLNRFDKAADGVFGRISALKLVTLEHAYDAGVSGAAHVWWAKIPPGTYVCQRGWHKLKSGWQGWTYLVTGIPDHSGILFHPGNKEDDSEGCILLGLTVLTAQTHMRWVTSSRRAFSIFMQAQAGADQFTLTVTDPGA